MPPDPEHNGYIMSITLASLPLSLRQISHYSSVLCIRQTKHDRELVPLMFP